MPAHRLVPRVLLLVGVILLGVAVCFCYGEWRFARCAERVDGKIVGVHRGEKLGSGYPVIRFRTKDGQSIEFRGNAPMSGAINGPGFRGYHVGQTLAVLYDPARPADAVIDEFLTRHVATITLALMGALPAGIGGTLLLLARRRRRRAEALRRSGQRVLATIVGVASDGSVRVNGRHPWRIEAKWRDPASGTMVTFRSEHIWIDPAPLLDREVGVFVDPRDLRRYAMDLAFLPEGAT